MTDDSNQLAHQAFAYIETVARPFVANGGRLWTKTEGIAGEAPASKLRKMLVPLDNTIAVTLTSDAARQPEARVIREHCLPAKRIAIETIDPLQGDPRCHSNCVLVGRAECPDDVLRIYRELAVIAYVTPEEDNHLSTAHKSSRWDAWEGDWKKRYAKANVEVFPIRKPQLWNVAP